MLYAGIRLFLNFVAAGEACYIFTGVSLMIIVPSSGYIDDLIGQQIIIVLLLVMASLSLVLFSVFLINIILFINKDYIINRLNNKLLKLYLKYQAFFIKLSLFWIPIFIFISLFTIIYGMVFIFSPPIPYVNVGIDLHIFVENSTNYIEPSSCYQAGINIGPKIILLHFVLGIRNNNKKLRRKLGLELLAPPAKNKLKVILIKRNLIWITLREKINNIFIYMKDKDYHYSFFFAGILKYLDINPVNNESDAIIQFSFSVFILSLISLLCLSNVIFYLISYLLVHKYNVINKFEKYPLIIKFINYYIKSSMVFVTLNLIMGIYSLLFLIILSLSILGVINI